LVQASSAAKRSFCVRDALWGARKGIGKSSIHNGSNKIVVITCDPCPCGAMTEHERLQQQQTPLPRGWASVGGKNGHYSQCICLRNQSGEQRRVHE
jgi:hypothetical protein